MTTKRRLVIPSSSNEAYTSYQYNNFKNLINFKTLPEGRFLKIDYYDSGKEKERVSKLSTPNGTIHTFSYNVDGGASFVRDAESNLTGYFYDIKTKRLQSIYR